MAGIIILVVVLLVLFGVPVAMYNTLVGKRNQVHNIFGTMDAMLKKRWDLIPNLVSTVKGYADHERGLFEAITEARAKAKSSSRALSRLSGTRGSRARWKWINRGVTTPPCTRTHRRWA